MRRAGTEAALLRRSSASRPLSPVWQAEYVNIWRFDECFVSLHRTLTPPTTSYPRPGAPRKTTPIASVFSCFVECQSIATETRQSSPAADMEHVGMNRPPQARRSRRSPFQLLWPATALRHTPSRHHDGAPATDAQGLEVPSERWAAGLVISAAETRQTIGARTRVAEAFHTKDDVASLLAWR